MSESETIYLPEGHEWKAINPVYARQNEQYFSCAGCGQIICSYDGEPFDADDLIGCEEQQEYLESEVQS